MKRIDMTVDFKSEVAAVFKVITNLKDCSWRSDLSRVEKLVIIDLLNMTEKIEKLRFLLQIVRQNIQFEYDVQTNNYLGHWSGQFAPLPDGGCRMFLF